MISKIFSLILGNFAFNLKMLNISRTYKEFMLVISVGEPEPGTGPLEGAGAGSDRRNVLKKPLKSREPSLFRGSQSR